MIMTDLVAFVVRHDVSFFVCGGEFRFSPGNIIRVRNALRLLRRTSYHTSGLELKLVRKEISDIDVASLGPHKAERCETGRFFVFLQRATHE